MVSVNAVRCKKCRDIIFSRARHDMHGCSCETVFIDGGFDYVIISFRGDLSADSFIQMKISVEQTPLELFDDWNSKTDKYGVIKEKPDEKNHSLL